jgi:23S rRNA (cytosine1962-C5)-methyltransferase
LPALIVDRYGDWLSVQFLDQGMDRLASEITQALVTKIAPKGILARNDAPVRSKENLSQEVKVLYGDVPDRVEFRMNGLNWRADLHGGQKTGIFLDQRQNYIAAAQYARGRALDCFGGTGGFALHIANKCESVEVVDASEQSLATAADNAKLNGIENVRFQEADALHYLPGLVNARKKFDTIIVDPPAFTKTRSARDGAMRGYKEINLRALRLLEGNGILVTCSCSHHVSEADLLEVIAGASLDVGRSLRIIERRTQAQDHPILLTVPETLYLKCLIFEVL